MQIFYLHQVPLLYKKRGMAGILIYTKFAQQDHLLFLKYMRQFHQNLLVMKNFVRQTL